MLPKKNRVNKKGVDLLFKKGKSAVSANLTFKFLATEFSTPQISVIVPKAVAKSAVKRNLLKRRGYRVLGKYINQFPAGILGVFIFRKYQKNVLIIEDEIKNILTKIN